MSKSNHITITLPRPVVAKPVSAAALAEVAIKRHMKETGSDRADVLVDLLTDLMHWAKIEGQDFNAALATAQMHARCELGEE